MQSCEAYISLAGQNVKEAVSPYVADGKVCVKRIALPEVN